MAVRFDAAADRLTHNGAYPQTSAGWTYTAWVRIDVDRNDYSTWLRTSASASTVATMGTNSDGLQGANYFTASGSATTSTLFTVGVWVPVAGTRSASSGDLFTYYQPTLGTTISGTVDLATSDITDTPDQICIGGRGSADANEWLNGDVAHVRIWSAELSQSEIEAEWASIAPVRTTDLHSNWPLYSYGDYTDTVASKTLVSQSGGVPSGANGPFPGTQNLCPNPSGQIDATGWVGALNLTPGTNNQTGDLVRVTGLLAEGFPVDTGFRYQAAGGFARSAQTAVTPGQEYTVSFFGKNDDTASLATCYLVWYRADGSDESYNNFGSFGGPTGGSATIHRKAMTNPAPVDAVAVGIIVDGGLDCYISCLKVEEGSIAYDYADGDTDGWVWDGTTGLSSSQLATGGGIDRAIDGIASAASLSFGALTRTAGMSGQATGASSVDSSTFAVLRGVAGTSSAGSSTTGGSLDRSAALTGTASVASGTAQTVLAVLRPLSGKATAASLARGALTNLSLSWGGYLGNLLDRGMEPVTVYLEEVTTDADGNTWTRAATEGIDTMATIQVAAASGTSSRRAEQDNEGFETEENWRIRFPRQFPYTLGAQSKVEWRGLTYSVVGDARRYNGSRRTAHIEYIIRRS